MNFVNERRFHPNRWTRDLFERYEPKYGFDRWGSESFDSWQEQFRDELESALGLPVIEEDGPHDLAAKEIDSEERYDHIRQKWVVRTERDFYVPFYLLLPDDPDDSLPVVIAVHGHGENGKETYVGRYETDDQRLAISEGERDVGLQAVRRGYAAIVPDMRGFGELSNVEDQEAGRGTCRTMQMHAQLFGRSLVGERVWDVSRLVDFVEGRPELDSDRIAITGNSGGGTVSLFAAAVDERISLSAPSSYFCTFEDSIASIHHCECNYVPGVARLGELSDVAGLIAPRPFLAIAGADDPIFPIDGTRRAFDALREIYEAAGAAGACELYVGSGGHRYYADGAWPFIDERL